MQQHQHVAGRFDAPTIRPPLSALERLLRAELNRTLLGADDNAHGCNNEDDSMTFGSCVRRSLLVVAFGCRDAAIAPDLPEDPSFAKGGAPVSERADFTISDAGLSLTSDGKGTYRDGICGASGSWTDATTLLAPALGKILKSQQASCVGIAPRTASVTLAVRHLSDDPHVDDAASPPGSGTFTVANVKFGWGSALATTINAGGSTPFCGSLGLRYTPVTFPGTSTVVRQDLGGGQWRMYTRPWPDNIGYCENGGVVAYWHVSFELYVQIVGG